MCFFVCHLQEDFLDLTVCVCGVSSLEEALWNMFVEEELFEGNNLYRCAQCSRLVTAAKVSTNNTIIKIKSSVKTFCILSLIQNVFLCRSSVCQAEAAAAVHDHVSAEIQLWLCKMWTIQGDRALQLPTHHQSATFLWTGTGEDFKLLFLYSQHIKKVDLFLFNFNGYG